MDTFAKIFADAKASKAEALKQLAQLDAGTLKIVNGMTEANARELLRLSIADYDAIIARLGPRDNA
ncbi:hypothetical protein [Pseudopontixanthobacter vadosimaris]|uniref:hypothetical protein n=1 Tax=Pseudopontixanthobacter vadosimaris TaxID=2726450 RepID=UPI00147603CE|nr:hypothetical protein [Pseudopontixanthobacter vadosimaris]